MSYQEEITKDNPICYLLVQYLDLVKETILCIKNIRFCLRKRYHIGAMEFKEEKQAPGGIKS